jgi:hypothetical protein
VPPAGAVHGLLAFDEGRDRLGDETGVERLAGGLDLVVSVRGLLLRLAHDPSIGLGERAVPEELPGPRRRAAGEIEIGGPRPLLPEQIRDQLDGRGDSRHDRVALLRVADRVLADVREPERPELPQQQHPSAEGARNACREQAGPGNEVEAE